MKRHESLALLSSDHHHGLNIAKMLRNLKTDELNEAFTRFKDFFQKELAEHFSEEEEILLPLFKDNTLINRMSGEHSEMRRMFKSLEETNDMEKALAEFGSYLDSHIRFEERELFPMIENTLSDNELFEIGKKIKERKSGSI